MTLSSTKKGAKTLVIGYGSIGSRFAHILTQMGCQVACLTKRDDIQFPVYRSLEVALTTYKPELIIVSNPTVEHYETCLSLEQLGYGGLVLVEKPLFDDMPPNGFTPSYRVQVGYNLRFHPVIRRIKELLRGRRLFSAAFSVGQYLPHWRPGTDYRQSYSAHAKQGGGVLRDLSHELDLSLWLCGPWKQASARLGHWNDLEIQAEDTVDVLAECTRCPSVTIHLDYNSLFPQRSVLIHADGLSLAADLIRGTIKTQDGEETYTCESNFTYATQLQAIMAGDFSISCAWAEGLAVVAFIQALENAALRTEVVVSK